MSDEPSIEFQYLPAEIGRHLADLRERAGKKQSDVAKEAGLSPTVLSRAESGERPLAAEDVLNVLRCIGTEECLDAMDALAMTWSVLPRPALGNSALRELWAAEQVAQALEAVEGPNDQAQGLVHYSTDARRLALFREEILGAASKVAQRSYQVAFIGPVGAGKSTAICGLAELQVAIGDGPVQPVLDAGPGRTTVCEVRLQQAPQFGILVDPYSDDELRQEVHVFAEHVLGKSRQEATGTPIGNDADSVLSVSAEVDRALRNLSALQYTTAPASVHAVPPESSSPSAQGRRRARSAPPVDPAAQLAAQFEDVQSLAFEILARMRTDARTARQLWYEPSSGLSPLAWLKKAFADINNGRHPDFSLPKCIHVCVPQQLIEVGDLEVGFVDTKGLDGTAARADLGALLDAEHTLCVLCTPFVGAPHSDLQRFLKHAHALGKSDLAKSIAVLVLARPDDTAGMQDPASGAPATTVDLAYDWKADQIYSELAKLHIGAENLRVDFYNARDESPQSAQLVIADQLSEMRSRYLGELEAVVRGAKQWLDGLHETQAREARARFSHLLLQNWTRYSQLPEASKVQAHSPVAEHVRATHPMRVHAAVVRQGEWMHFSFSYLLGMGARQLAQSICQETVGEIRSLCKTLIQDKAGYGAAAELVEQVLRVLDARYDDLLRKVQLRGSTLAHERLRKDTEFWQRCERQMGRGSGYIDIVSSHTDDWFTQRDEMQIENELRASVEREWTVLLAAVRELIAD